MRELKLANVTEATEYKKVSAGGYVCGITKVEDVADKDYLSCEYDIIEGEFKGYYKALSNSKNFWGAKFFKSYKELALPFFKAFILAVEGSNAGYIFKEEKWAELKGKKVGLVLSEEEYIGKDGSVKTRLYVSSFTTVNAIQKGDYMVKPIERLSGTTQTVAMEVDSDEPYPF